jgi:signal transduction histidine kinase
MLSATSHRPAAVGKQKVLIVDDDQEFADSIVDILRPAGYEAIVVDRSEDARLVLQREELPVAMLDIRLGRASGVDLLAGLHELRPDLICVMMTAHADTQTAIAALRQGAYDYFDKSSEPAELLAVLDRCFENSRLHEERRSAYEALRVAKEAAEKANRTKSEFLANISHELRTPLNAIIGFSEVMMQGILGPVGNDSYLGYLKDIHDSGIDLLNIINDILDLSKAEAGKLELSEQTVDVATVLDAVGRLMAPKIDSAGLTLALDVPADLGPLFCDRLKLKQILLNILSNAVKFTPFGGRVEISATCDPGVGFVIVIRDSGIGIAKDDIPRVLLPFEQVESALSRSRNGTGLGLPLTAAMMHLHGGALEIDSEIDRGTTVTIRFPPERIVDEREDAVPEPVAALPKLSYG